MSQLNADAWRGVKLLLGRQLLVQLLTFGAGIVLARTLDPVQFGLYGIATYLVSTVALFGDFGLMPSLVQRKEELTDRDLRVGFTVQQMLTTAAVAVLVLFSPFLVSLYPKAPPETRWLVVALAFDLYLCSWRSMSALQLERHLMYDRLARVEIIETVCYQAVAVALAVTGHGVWSFVIATLARGLLGTTLLYRAAPWKPGFLFDAKVAREIASFGVPYQLQCIANQSAGWITPVMVGTLIGPQAVGLLTWASSNGRKPLLMVGNVMRVAFAHFARLQDDPESLGRMLARYLVGLLLPAGLWFSLILTCSPSLVPWIFTAKWVPAVPALILTAAAMLFEVFGWVIATALNGLGKINFTTRVVLMRSAGHALLSIPLLSLMGFDGVPVAYLIAVAATIPWLTLGLNRECIREAVRPLNWILAPVLVSTISGMLLNTVSLSSRQETLMVLLCVVVSYLVTAWISAPDWVIALVREGSSAWWRRVWPLSTAGD